MEDTLGVPSVKVYPYYKYGLNPCSNGRYSRRKHKKQRYGKTCVLILVLMEDTLGVAVFNDREDFLA